MENTRPTATWWRKALRFAAYSIFAIFLLAMLAIYALTLPAVQQRLTRKAETFLREKLGTRVAVGAIRLRFPGHLSLENFLLEDQQGDTLAWVGSLVVSMDMWKLLDQSIELHQITLEEAAVYLHQKDSTYNFDFITKAFAGEAAPTPTDTAASAWKLQLDLTVLQLKKVNFRFVDETSETTIQANIGTAETTIAKADLKTRAIVLDGLNLADADIRYVQKKAVPSDGKPSAGFDLLLKKGDISRSHLLYAVPEMTLETNLEKTTLGTLQLQSVNGALAIRTTDLQMENSALAYFDSETTPTPGHLNAGDLDLTRLYAHIPEFSYQNDTLFLQAQSLSGADKSGLLLHALRTTARVTPSGIALQKTLARLNQTTLDGDVGLFKNKSGAFDRMQVQLRQLKGVFGDLIPLLPPPAIPALSQLRDLPYEVSGKLSGWLENLKTQDIRFQAGSATIAHFNGSVQQLADFEKLGMSLNISRLETNRADLVRWMSATGTPQDSLLIQPLPAFLSTSGEVSGTMALLRLSLRGALGALQTGPLSPPLGDPPLLFELAGTLANANNPDSLSMDLQVNRLDAPSTFFAFLDLKKGQLPDLLQATGTLKGTLATISMDLAFKAQRGSADSRAAVSGTLKNLQTPERLGFDLAFEGAFPRAELVEWMSNPQLRLPESVQLNGHARGTIQDASADAGINLGTWGQIRLDGTLRDSSYQLNLRAHDLLPNQLLVDTLFRPLKTVGLTAHLHGTGFQFGKTARLQLDGKLDSLIWDNLILRDIALDADVNGARFTGGFQSPDERAAVRVRVSGDFSTAIPLLKTDIALNCVDLRAFGWSNRPTAMCMRVRSRSEGLSMDTLTAHVSIESIDLQYDTVHIHPGDISLDVKLDKRQNRIDLRSDWLQGELKGYFVPADLPKTLANIAEQYFVVDRTGYLPPVGTDSLSLQLHLLRTEVLTTGLLPGLVELGPVSLEASLVAPRNYFNLAVQAPRIAYLGWEVDSLNVRAYAGDTAALFVLTTPLVKREAQDFIENAVLNGRFQANVADVSFKASNDAGRERFLLGLQALLNGKTKETLVKWSPRQVLDYKEWTVDADNQIRIAPNGVEVRKFALVGDGQSIKVEGATRKLAANKTGLDFTVDIDRFNYNNFDLFVAGVVRELEGWADAHLKIKGTTDAPQVRGRLQLHETAFTPVLTNVHYRLGETPLEFTEQGLVLDGLTLTDPYNKTLKINGKLSTKDWSNIQTNLTLHADRWQVLNSTKQQNPLYFGELYVSLDGTVRGPVSQPDIRLVLKTDKASTFTYVYDVATQALQHEGIVYFLPPPRQYVRPAIYDAPVNIQPYTLSASIEIDSNLTISSVINPVTGDDFRGKATGKLQYDLLSNGNMTLAGQVELVRGVYNYSYQSVVKRSFEVTAGSTITWTGDAFAPELALKARYQFKASPYPLVVNQLLSASAEEAASYRRPQTFFLQTSLNGSATLPDVSFQFIYPSAEKQESLSASFGNQQADLVQSALSNVNQDKNLLSRQVFGVLLLRNFIGETVGATSISTGSNPLQSGLSSFLTGQLNALADQYLTWIDVDLATTEGASSTGASQAENTTNYQLRLQKSFFEDRLTFKISGGTSVGGANGDNAHSALENASVEYALTPNGELKVSLFSERGFELLNASSANLRNSGAGLILAKEFGGKKHK